MRTQSIRSIASVTAMHVMFLLIASNNKQCYSQKRIRSIVYCFEYPTDLSILDL